MVILFPTFSCVCLVCSRLLCTATRNTHECNALPRGFVDLEPSSSVVSGADERKKNPVAMERKLHDHGHSIKKEGPRGSDTIFLRSTEARAPS